jgi:hypothetical protein
MGLNDVMEVTEKYMSLYMVYADVTKGWVIADGKGCDEDAAGGEITVDTTIYLAPSAAADSPDGIVGSDDTGDGSINAPFYSIKRAMEYLENFRIKIGVYVTIKGLPGHYHYNDDHVVEIKHKDAKYIKIKFDMFETGKYLETKIDFNTAASIDTTNYNSTTGKGYVLATFVVDDIGTGFYQIKQGDYIKVISKDYGNGNSFERAVWNGYHRVTAVDVPNKKVTIIFKYYAHYDTNKPMQLLPASLPATDEIYIYKPSSHAYITIDDPNSLIDGKNYIYSEYGFGGIQINASYENHYDPLGTITWDVTSFIYIYDGVLNDILLNINGFRYGAMFENLLCNFDYDITDPYKSSNMLTSCHTGLYYKQSSTKIKKIVCNNCSTGVYGTYSDIVFTGETLKSFINLHGPGVSCDNSKITANFDYDYNKIMLLGYAADGYQGSYHSSYRITGSYIKKCYFGIGLLTTSSCRTCIQLMDNLSGKPKQIISDCNTAVYVNSSSNVDLRNIDISNSYTGISAGNSQISAAGYETSIHDCTRGVYIYASTCDLVYLNVSDCTSYGISSNRTLGRLSQSTLDNNNVNLYLLRGSYMYILYCDIENADYGIYTYNSVCFINNDSSHNISGNTHDIFCRYGGVCNVYTDNNIPNMDPTANNTPSWSGVHGGSRICYTEY